MKTVYLGIPTMGWLSTELATWVHETRLSGGIEMVPHYTNNISPVAWARNKIVRDFLASEKDVLLMVDSDTVPPEHAVNELLYLINNGASVATGITPIVRKGIVSMNVYTSPESVQKCIPFTAMPDRPFEVVGCGAACIMMTRNILKKLQDPYFKTIEFDNGGYCSEDLYFCDKVRAAGGTIVAHPDVVCGHVKEVTITSYSLV